MDADRSSLRRSMNAGNKQNLYEAHGGSFQNHTPTSSKAHTLTACCRCRQRKTRCDVLLPRCGPCERSNAICEYFDATKGKKVPRTYVTHLQSKVQALEAELAQLGNEHVTSLDAEIMIRNPGRVRFNETDEYRFLGPSSGIAMTRLVMELAKQNTDTKSIREVVPYKKARQIKDCFIRESSKPTSKVYPLISDVAAPDLPTRELTERLVENFNQKAQYMLPTLHEPSFRRVVEDVYHGSMDGYKNFTLRMVLAISMQKLDKRYAGLADSYYLAALPYLQDAIRPMNLGTLQCFALIAQYSLVTPTRTASYWVVGLATRLAQDLGITEEATVVQKEPSLQANALDIDMRRRLFWIITSMEFGLAHSLGRPSSLGTSHGHIDVGFFEAVDDQFITSAGVLPKSPPSIKKRIAIHFFKMRLLQAEIRRTLYLKKKPEPKSDHDPWYKAMEIKLEDWRSSSPNNDEGSGLSEAWFRGRYNTMVIFLYRPSPQIPEPSAHAAEVCFEASRFNIYLQREEIASGSIDLTWIFTQSVFLSLNTVLWTLSYSEIRKEHPKGEVERHLNTVLESIYLASERWPGVESALELYDNLITACLKAYDGNSGTSYVVSSPSNKSSPASLQDAVTPHAFSSPSTITSSLSSTQNVQSIDHSSPFGYVIEHHQRLDDDIQSATAHLDGNLSKSSQSSNSQNEAIERATFNFDPLSQGALFDTNSLYNTFPSKFVGLNHWDPNYSASSPRALSAAYFIPHTDQQHHLASIGDQYSQYLHSPYQSRQQFQSLTQEQQIELMKTLEMDVIPECGT